MRSDFPELSTLTLAQGAGYDQPPAPPPLVHLDNPALDVMTDFRHVRPVTCSAEIGIDEALALMKREGVRLLLVVAEDAERSLIGVITAADIRGERPIKLAAANRMPRAEIRVADTMSAGDGVPVLNLVNVRNAQVGHVLQTLKRLEQQHVLVAEVQPDRMTVRGMFSASQIARHLGTHFEPDIPPADSLAQIEHEVARRRGERGGDQDARARILAGT